MSDQFAVGDEFVCEVCGKREVHTRTHEEMVAIYEAVYGKKYNPKTTIIVCDECGDRAVREEYGVSAHDLGGEG